MANTSKLLSNAKVQKNKLFAKLQEMLMEDGLLTSNLNKATLKQHTSAMKGLGDAKKAFEALGGDGDPSQLMKDMTDIAKGKNGNIPFVKNSDASKIKEAAAAKAVAKSSGIPYSDNEKAFTKQLVRTKAGISKDAALGMAEDYFVNPFKQGINAKRTGDSEAMKTAFTKGAARVGAAGGAVIGLKAIGDDRSTPLLY